MQEKSNSTNPYHPDVALFLVMIPFISAFNYYLTYSNIHLSWFLLLTFSLDTIQGYLAWWGVRSFIFYLDKKWPYEKGLLQRIIFQLISSLVIGLAIISLLTELVSWIAKGKPAPLNFYTIDLFIISIWFFVINGIYVGLRYYNLWQQAENEREEARRMKVGGIVVRQGRQEVRLTFEELAGFYVEGEFGVACHMNGKKYYVDLSLDRLEKTMPANIFFRLNRQFILHRQLISGFKRIEDGKLVVMPAPHDCFPREITVSRTKAPSFKSWFRPD